MLACYIINSLNSWNSKCILPNHLDFTLLCLASCSDPTNHQSVDWVMLVWKSLSAVPQGPHPLLHNSLATHAVGALHCLSEKLTQNKSSLKITIGIIFLQCENITAAVWMQIKQLRKESLQTSTLEKGLNP